MHTKCSANWARAACGCVCSLRLQCVPSFKLMDGILYESCKLRATADVKTIALRNPTSVELCH